MIGSVYPSDTDEREIHLWFPAEMGDRGFRIDCPETLQRCSGIWSNRRIAVKQRKVLTLKYAIVLVVMRATFALWT